MNRIGRFLILLLMCVSLVTNMMAISVPQTSFASSNEEDALDSANAKALFASLGIDVVTNPDMATPATREHFITLLMGLMNLKAPVYENSTFEDVAPSSELASITNYAMNLGIISKAQKFYPDGNVEYAAACKMIVEALGRGAEAAALGGYPYGYMMVASSNDLDMGLSNGEYLTVSDMYIMLANLAETNVYAVTSYSYDDGQLHYRVSNGESMLKAYHDITIVEGIVDAANGSYLYDPKTPIDQNCVSIDNTIYKVSQRASCPLGMRVKAYVKDISKTRGEIVFATNTENNVTLISSFDDPVFSDGKLSYVNASGKEITLKSLPDKAVVYNGRAYEYCRDADFSIESGYIEAIDNNGDYVVDVFAIWESDYIEVAYVDSYNGVIYDSKYRTNVFLDNEDICYDSKYELDSFSQGNVLEVYISKDKKYIKLDTLRDSVSGTVTGFGADSRIFVDDVPYNTTPYFEDFYRQNVEIGKKFSFAINGDGAIVSVKSFGRSGFKFAYFDAIRKSNGLSGKVTLKIFNQNGETEFLSLSDKLRIDSKTYSFEEAYTVLSEKVGSVIKCQSDSDGCITDIITISASEGIYNSTYDGYNAIKRYRFLNDETEDLMYYKITGYFVPHFIIDSSTIIFCVSDNADNDEDKFSIGGLNFLQNDERIPKSSIKAYNVDNSGCAQIILYKAPDISVNSSLGDNAPSGVVVKCARFLGDDGEMVYKTIIYSGDKYTTYYIRSDETFVEKMNLAEGELPFNMGDVIRFSSSNEYIVNAVKDFDGQKRSLLNGSGDNQEVHYYYGKIYSIGPSSVAVLNDDGSLIYLPVALSSVCVIDDNDVYTAPKETVASYMQVGDDASTILLKCRYSTVNATFVFK